MMGQESSQTGRTVYLALIVVTCAGLGGCTTDISTPGAREVTVAPVRDPNAADGTGMTRDELEEQVRRFADRFSTRLSLAADLIMQQATTPRLRADAQVFQVGAHVSIVDIAVGQNAVTNLLDAIVLATLTRLMVENYFVPEVLGEEMGQELLSTTRDLEQDVWKISEKVLTPAQQEALRTLILDWYNEHREEHYIWGIRFGEFSGQRAAELKQVAQTGGLLAQVQKTRETVDEIRALGERVLYYMQRAPYSVRMEAQYGFYEALAQPEIQTILEDANSITTSVERFAAVAEELPDKRLQAIDQLGDRLAAERAAFMEDLFAERVPELIDQLGDRLAAERAAFVDDLFAEEDTVRGVLEDLEQTVAATDKLVTNVDELAERLKLGQGKPLDVNELHQVVVGASEAAGEFATLVEKVEGLMASPAWDKRIPQATQAVDEVGSDVHMLIREVFIFAIALAVVVFALMIVFAYARSRFARRSVPG